MLKFGDPVNATENSILAIFQHPMFCSFCCARMQKLKQKSHFICTLPSQKINTTCCAQATELMWACLKANETLFLHRYITHSDRVVLVSVSLYITFDLQLQNVVFFCKKIDYIPTHHCNPFKEERFTTCRKNVRNVHQWMIEKIPYLQSEYKMCDKCSEKLSLLRFESNNLMLQ
jgi:hypothetical protein